MTTHRHRRVHTVRSVGVVAFCAALMWTTVCSSQALPMQGCEADSPPPFCNAVRGDRTQGWKAQGRSEVMARRGMVATSQPLAAQIGLQVLRDGGNAIDAAVATAAALSVTEPKQVGVAGDLFVVIYSARDKKLHVLNASGTAPTGATLARMNALGYWADPSTPGPTSGMPAWGITTVTVPSAAWGWQEVLERHAWGGKGRRGLAAFLPDTSMDGACSLAASGGHHDACALMLL